MFEKEELELEFNKVLSFMNERFGEDSDLQAVLFMIGVQELGKGYAKFNKNQKMDIMHVAICTLLEPYGYYEFEGLDAEGWPHFKETDKLPFLKPGQQGMLMKQAVIDYFKKNEII